MSTTINDKVKMALRISSTALDDEINDNIAAAKEELMRIGVPETVVSSEGDLVVLAIKLFVQSIMTADEKDATRYAESFRLKADEIRKTEWEIE